MTAVLESSGAPDACCGFKSSCVRTKDRHFFVRPHPAPLHHFYHCSRLAKLHILWMFINDVSYLYIRRWFSDTWKPWVWSCITPHLVGLLFCYVLLFGIGNGGIVFPSSNARMFGRTTCVLGLKKQRKRVTLNDRTSNPIEKRTHVVP